ncbi:pyridoxal phosphate-dependent transferase [Phycomyces nitens]|nr:pyridoxal phosphate-dependent transferase [Phycomyces nitens]
MSLSDNLAQFGIQHITRGAVRCTDLVIARGSGTYLWTVDGKKYLDLSSGYGVTNTGHCHPTVVKAVQEQAANIPHAQMNMFFHKPMLDLIEALKPKMPSPKFNAFSFWNSGSEAIEASIKLARHATKKYNVVVFQGAYHGSTFGAASLNSSNSLFSTGYGPLMSGVHIAPYPYYQKTPGYISDPEKFTPERCSEDALLQLDNLFKQRVSPHDTAAILIEPIQGEGGYVVPPKGYLEGVRAICDKYNILMICDEVQSGFGRTGKMFAVEHTTIVPDIMVLAKGIASGYPLSCIVANKSLMDCQPVATMVGTYGGNAISCAAAKATLRVFEDDNLLENCNERSKQFFSALAINLPAVLPEGATVDVRGRGLMIGIEFLGVPEGFSESVRAEALKRDTIVLRASIYETLRVVPPLTITKEEADLAIQRITEAVAAASKNIKA